LSENPGAPVTEITDVAKVESVKDQSKVAPRKSALIAQFYLCDGGGFSFCTAKPEQKDRHRFFLFFHLIVNSQGGPMSWGANSSRPSAHIGTGGFQSRPKNDLPKATTQPSESDTKSNESKPVDTEKVGWHNPNLSE
jgi:hypothetical protein